MTGVTATSPITSSGGNIPNIACANCAVTNASNTFNSAQTMPSVVMPGSTSGTTTLVPSAVAGTTTATLPANTGTIGETNLAQTWSAGQNFTSYIRWSTVTIAASATPTISVQSGPNQTITLNANATPTVSGIAAGIMLNIEICQPSSGGPFTWTWPAAIHSTLVIGTGASTCSIQSFVSYNGTTLIPTSLGVTGVAQ